MQQICPVCNGMVVLTVPCPQCGKTMEDQGHASDYFGPYSPYEENIWPRLTGQVLTSALFKCIHFLKCPNCGKDTCRPISRVTV